MAEDTQQEFVRAEQKARAGEEMVRKVNQKEADKAMDVRRGEGQGGHHCVCVCVCCDRGRRMRGWRR